jgi:hypothetical protein
VNANVWTRLSLLLIFTINWRVHVASTSVLLIRGALSLVNQSFNGGLVSGLD